MSAEFHSNPKDGEGEYTPDELKSSALEGWYEQNFAFVDRYLDPDFSLNKSDMVISGKRFGWRRRKKVSVLETEQLPSSIQKGSYSISIKLDSIYQIEIEDVVLGLARKIVADVVCFKGEIAYGSTSIRDSWVMDMRVGQTINVSNLRGLYRIIPPETKVFQVKQIDLDKQIAKIGPITGS